MAIPTPNTIYDVSVGATIAQGLHYDDDEVQELIEGPVKDILEDSRGKKDLQSLIGSVASTEFEHIGLEKMLQDETKPDNWKVGEAIAEVFVAETGQNNYPWPTGRDLKNPNASPAGCDLTGFQIDNDPTNPYRFSFGEVKTSEQDKSPPDVMRSLNKQLLGLRDDRKIKDALCRYLGHHSTGTPWRPMFLSAAKRYLSSDCQDVAIYGVLLRDLAPQGSDISGCASTMSDSCPAQTDIEVYALYLPLERIGSLGSRATAILDGGVTE